MSLNVQTTLKAYKKADFTTVREHEEFVWLHDRFVENEEYAGIIVSICCWVRALWWTVYRPHTPIEVPISLVVQALQPASQQFNAQWLVLSLFSQSQCCQR